VSIKGGGLPAILPLNEGEHSDGGFSNSFDFNSSYLNMASMCELSSSI